jgi:hypothetical protein
MEPVNRKTPIETSSNLDSQVNNLQAIPMELAVQIFAYLGRDLRNARQVSKTCLSIALEADKLKFRRTIFSLWKKPKGRFKYLYNLEKHIRIRDLSFEVFKYPPNAKTAEKQEHLFVGSRAFFYLSTRGNEVKIKKYRLNAFQEKQAPFEIQKTVIQGLPKNTKWVSHFEVTRKIALLQLCYQKERDVFYNVDYIAGYSLSTRKLRWIYENYTLVKGERGLRSCAHLFIRENTTIRTDQLKIINLLDGCLIFSCHFQSGNDLLHVAFNGEAACKLSNRSFLSIVLRLKKRHPCLQNYVLFADGKKWFEVKDVIHFDIQTGNAIVELLDRRFAFVKSSAKSLSMIDSTLGYKNNTSANLNTFLDEALAFCSNSRQVVFFDFRTPLTEQGFTKWQLDFNFDVKRIKIVQEGLLNVLLIESDIHTAVYNINKEPVWMASLSNIKIGDCIGFVDRFILTYDTTTSRLSSWNMANQAVTHKDLLKHPILKNYKKGDIRGVKYQDGRIIIRTSKEFLNLNF